MFLNFPFLNKKQQKTKNSNNGTSTKTNIDQWNRIESPETKLHTCGQLIYDKETRIYNGEKTVSSISSSGETGQPHVKEWN